MSTEDAASDARSARSLESPAPELPASESPGPKLPGVGAETRARLGARRYLGLRASALLEIGLFLLLAVALDEAVFSGGRYWGVEPHPFWIIVLLAAAQYGTNEGMLAASLAFLSGQIPDQELGQDIYAYTLTMAKHPVLWFVAAVTLGELRGRHQRERAELVADLDETRVHAKGLGEAYRRVARIKENLEIRVSGQLRTFLSTYETAKLIERSDPGEVLLAIVDVVRAIVAPEKFSLFLLNNQVLEAAIQDGWRADDRFARTFAKSTRLYEEIVEDRRIVCLTNEADEAVLGAEGVLAGPLIRTDTGAVIGMLKVERLDLLDLNVSTVENLRALSTWIGTAYAKAVDASSRAEDLAQSDARTVLPNRYLAPQQYFLISLGRRQGFDVSALTLDLANPGDVVPERKAQLADAAAAAVRSALGSSSLAFEQGEGQGGFVVLLPGVGARNAAAAAERLQGALDTQLRAKAPEARFEARVRTLYQHEGRV